MRKKKCEVVVLETPITNVAALKLYTSLGFCKTKYLTRYYLDGCDAVRLKLWLKPFFAPPAGSSVLPPSSPNEADATAVEGE